MIKKGSDGKVIEFEDEAAVAAMHAPRGSKDLKPVVPTGDAILTEEQAMAAHAAAVKEADVQAETDLKKLTDELGVEVAKLDEVSKAEKRESKERLKIAIDEAERVRRETVMRAEQVQQSDLKDIWARYRTAMDPINKKLEAGKASIESARLEAQAAILTIHKERLASINKAKTAEAKVAAVAAESLPAVAP